MSSIKKRKVKHTDRVLYLFTSFLLQKLSLLEPYLVLPKGNLYLDDLFVFLGVYGQTCCLVSLPRGGEAKECGFLHTLCFPVLKCVSPISCL